MIDHTEQQVLRTVLTQLHVPEDDTQTVLEILSRYIKQLSCLTTGIRKLQKEQQVRRESKRFELPGLTPEQRQKSRLHVTLCKTGVGRGMSSISTSK